MLTNQNPHGRRRGWLVAAAALLLAATGCHTTKEAVIPLPPPGSVPNELSKVVLPPYVIDPPDELLIEVVKRPQSTEKGGDNETPLALTPQPISGRHQVRMDGTVGLGVYGSVPVAGRNLEQAREDIRNFIAARTQDKPEELLVVVDVLGFNSKSYYVITDGGGYGEAVYQFPSSGNENVLSALANIQGIPYEGSKRNIWVARRSPHGGHQQILPVDWVGISQHGIAETNWQIMPGDRVYVKADKLIATDRKLQKVLSPVERVFGVTLLGASTVNQISGRGLQNNNNANR